MQIDYRDQDAEDDHEQQERYPEQLDHPGLSISPAGYLPISFQGTVFSLRPACKVSDVAAPDAQPGKALGRTAPRTTI